MPLGNFAGLNANTLFRDKTFRGNLASFLDFKGVEIGAPNTSSYTLVSSDAGKLVMQNSSSANSVTVPNNSVVPFGTGTEININNMGIGQTSIVAASGVTINSADGALKLRVQYSTATLIKVGVNTWLLVGDITT